MVYYFLVLGPGVYMGLEDPHISLHYYWYNILLLPLHSLWPCVLWPLCLYYDPKAY